MKPPYTLPLLRDLEPAAATAPTVISTFSGCGGTCLGFRQAGYNIRAASEFVPAARDTYQANHDAPVDDRDIRTVTGRDLLDLAQLDEVDVLEGSPPCSSFSVSGKREAGWGDVHPYSDVAQRTDDLFDEYVRLVRELRPRIFVAENVAGLARGVSIGYLRRTLRSLADADYRVEARLLDAARLGVPQTRQRIIILGVRRDLATDPAFPNPLPYTYTIRDALPNIANGPEPDDPDPTAGDFTRMAIATEWRQLALGTSSDRYFNLIRPNPDQPTPTITATSGSISAASVTHPYQPRKFSAYETLRLASFPPDFVLTGTYKQQVERIGRSVPPRMAQAIATALLPILTP